MSVNIPINYPDDNTPNIAPSSPQDKNWAPMQVLWEQKITAAVNAALSSSGGGQPVWGDWVTFPSLINGSGTLQMRTNTAGDCELRGQVLFTGYTSGTPLAVVQLGEPPFQCPGTDATQWPAVDFNNDEIGIAAVLVSDSKLYINTPATSGDPLIDFGCIRYSRLSWT